MIRLTASDEPLRVVKHLGVGGEGDVFELASRSGDQRFALKWFHAHTSTRERRQQIANLVERGAPSDNFLWPYGIIDDVHTGRFGYVMDLRPPDYAGLAALLRGDFRRRETSVVRFAFELAKSFMALHTLGLCYRDINFGNAFMHPGTGHALICDNDNVGIDGVSPPLVLGSRKFMAPEIVRREALPSKYTDRHSLAVMLFYLLLVHHPLEGSKTEAGLADPAADLRHYGYDPLFCFDPKDGANRPSTDHHAHVTPLWETYPMRLRALFTQAFTVGLHDPRRRVVDSEWCAALADLTASYFPCPNCAWPRYLDGDLVRCPRCRVRPDALFALEVGGSQIVVREGAFIAAHHLSGDLDLYDSPVAWLSTGPGPATPAVLRNMSDDVLTVKTPPEAQVVIDSIAPGASAALPVGSEVTVGRSGPTSVARLLRVQTDGQNNDAV